MDGFITGGMGFRAFVVEGLLFGAAFLREDLAFGHGLEKIDEDIRVPGDSFFSLF